MYLTRKEILSRGPFWDPSKVASFPHDMVKKSDTGRGRPSYLYLQSRVEAFERGESIPSALVEALPKPKSTGNELESRLDRALAKADKPVGAFTPKHATFLDAFASATPGNGLPGNDVPKVPSVHASVFNEGPKVVSQVRPIVPPAISQAITRHAPLVIQPTPKGEKPRIRLIVVDSEGRESLVQTPRVD
jgi:hypothetical protein